MTSIPPTYVYPPALDPEDVVQAIPGHQRSEGWLAFVRAVAAPIAQVDADLADYVSQLTYRETATGEALAALGSWVGEPVGGLTTGEYRRVVLASLAGVAARQEWAWDAAHRVASALTGSDDLEMEVMGPCQVRTWALVRYHPSPRFATRCRRVIQRATPPGYYWSLHMYPEGAVLADEIPGADVGLASWYISAPGGR